jgi:hypothetical protein
VDPYRTSTSTSSHVARTRSGAGELILPFAMLWVVSLFRLVTALVNGRALGALDTLAAFALVLLPWALARGRVRLR